MKQALLLLPLLLAPLAWQDAPPAEQTAAKGPVVGAPAPALRLNDHTGRAVAVGGAGGERWTVLAFYPKAMTPG